MKKTINNARKNYLKVFQQANHAFQQKNYDKAIALYTNCLEINNTRQSIYLNIASACKKSKQFEQQQIALSHAALLENTQTNYITEPIDIKNIVFHTDNFDFFTAFNLISIYISQNSHNTEFIKIFFHLCKTWHHYKTITATQESLDYYLLPLSKSWKTLFEKMLCCEQNPVDIKRRYHLYIEIQSQFNYPAPIFDGIHQYLAYHEKAFSQIQLLEDLLNRYPDDNQLRYEIANSYRIKGGLEKSFTLFQPILSHDTISHQQLEYLYSILYQYLLMHHKFIANENIDNNMAIIMMVKNEQAILQQNLNWHYQLGIRQYVIIDHGSTDNTPEILKKFAQKDVQVHIINDQETGLHKDKKLTQAYHLALTQFAPQWVFILDADEFIQPGKYSLQHVVAILNTKLEQPVFEKTFLATVAQRVLSKYNKAHIGLRYSWRNYRTTSPIPVKITDPLQQITLKDSRPSDFYLYDYNACPTKVSISSINGITITQGHHDILYKEKLIPCIDADIFHLTLSHYPIRDYQQFKNKYIQGGLAYRKKTNSQPGEGRYWKMIHRAYLNEGETALERVYQRFIQRNKVFEETNVE